MADLKHEKNVTMKKKKKRLSLQGKIINSEYVKVAAYITLPVY